MGRLNGIAVAGLLLVALGAVSFAVPMFKTSQTKDVANFGLQSIVAHSLGPKVWRQEYEGGKKLGASHFTLRTHRSTPPKPNSAKPAETIGEHIQVLETFIRELR